MDDIRSSLKKYPASPLVSGVIILLIIITGTAFSQEQEWIQALSPRNWLFPRDHGAHPDYRTEWWYFTGNLADEEGNQYGYQLTFFRQGLRYAPSDPDNLWSIRDVYFGHFALTDVAQNKFYFTDRASRRGPGLAGAETEKMRIWLLTWSVTMDQNMISLIASQNGMELNLSLTPKKPPVLHGEDGLSKKGLKPGQASHYYSFTRIATRGFIRTPSRDSNIRVTGTSWFDHEFSSYTLDENLAGWDWFSLHLSDGTDVMIYILRRKDGTIDPASSGTIVNPAGDYHGFKNDDFIISVLDHWKSPASGAIYPSKWRIQIPHRNIDLTVTPLIANQELDTENSTGIIYWEGAVTGTGNFGDAHVSCHGYVELTGYAGPLGTVF